MAGVTSMRFLSLCLTACLALSACGGGEDEGTPAEKAAKAKAATAAGPAAATATLTRNIPLAACLEEQTAAAEVATTVCPTYVLLALDSMMQMCVAAGGTIQPAEAVEAWALDVNADGRSEVLVDLNKNYICYGAPSVFSCGSLGCPYFLYSPRGDAWVELGAINADDAPNIELLAADQGEYATLRGGCLGERPCSELTHYEWKGSNYERTWIDYRNNLVDVLPGGLWTLTKDTAVRTAPNRTAPVLDEYPEGTTVVVIGTARSGPYSYVSPCNACRRGFVETALLRKD
ncbi:MAG TPA: hypothetical protein VH856_08430 [Steroidobacteraceae bacterium]